MSDKIRACFTGCSFTVGEGFPEDQRDTYIYDRLVSNYFGFSSTNLARGGLGNHRIFMITAQAIMSKKYEIVFVQWSGLNRIWLSPGPDVWFASNSDDLNSFRYRDIYIHNKDKKTFVNTLNMLDHDYQNIIDLIDYCSIVNNLADANGVKIVHINGLVPWESDLTKPLDRTDLEQFFGQYIKDILDFDNRPDDEVCFYFNKLHAKFQELDTSRWVNLFDSFLLAQTDTGPLGHHPGIQSHKDMADKIINYLDKEMK